MISLIRLTICAMTLVATAVTPAFAGPGSADQDELVGLRQARQRAELDVALAELRLRLLDARFARIEGRFEAAAELARGGLAEAEQLARDMDVAVYQKQFRDVLRNVESRKTSRSTTDVAASPTANEDVKERLVADPRQPSAQPYPWNRGRYRPAEMIVDAEALLAGDSTAAPGHDLYRLGASYGAVSTFPHVEPPRQAKALAFPDDWAAKTAWRKAHRHGRVWKGPNRTTKDGKTFYTAIYDVSDLLLIPPAQFRPPPETNTQLAITNALDREALRQYSDIFSGTARDLAEGIPLLQYFGGLDFSNGSNSAANYRRNADRLVQLLDAVANQP